MRTMKKTDGFTLVELIVVIAILAILAAVAIPAYSGYIEKANTAGDQQLLAAVNRAFVSACVENGVNNLDLDSDTAKIPLSEGKIDYEDVLPANIRTSFETYMTGNADAEFKTAQSLSFNEVTGVFKLSEDMQFTFGGVSINVSKEVYEALRASTYATMGGEVLGESVDSVSGLAAVLIAGPYIDWDGTAANWPTTGIFSMAMNETFLASLGLTRDEVFAEMDESEASANAMAQKLANGLILYAAKDASGFTTEKTNTIISSMTSSPVDYVGQLKTGLTNGDSTALSEAALVYSLYTSYVYDKDPATAQDKLDAVNGSVGLINALDTMTNDSGFTDYMKGQGAKDVEAFKQAMGVINSAAQNGDVSDKVKEEGFATTELTDILEAVLGK